MTAQVRTIIVDMLQYLPQESYTDEDVTQKSVQVYQHIYSVYNGTFGQAH